MPSLGGTTMASAFSCVRSLGSRRVGTLTPQASGLLCRLPVPARIVERGGPLRFLWSPCHHALLYDPGQAVRSRPVGNERCCLRTLPIASALTIHAFRDSITQPADSLSTLRSRDCSQATQDSLPAGGRLYGVDFCRPRGSHVRFCFMSSSMSCHASLHKLS